MKLNSELTLHHVTSYGAAEFYTLDVNGRPVETVHLNLGGEDGGLFELTLFGRAGVDAFCAAAQKIIEQVKRKRLGEQIAKTSAGIEEERW